MLRLQSFKYKVVYKTGKSNIVDILSRLSTNNEERCGEKDKRYIAWLVKEITLCAMTMDEINSESRKDKVLTKVRNALKNNDWRSLKNS